VNHLIAQRTEDWVNFVNQTIEQKYPFYGALAKVDLKSKPGRIIRAEEIIAELGQNEAEEASKRLNAMNKTRRRPKSHAEIALRSASESAPNRWLKTKKLKDRKLSYVYQPSSSPATVEGLLVCHRSPITINLTKEKTSGSTSCYDESKKTKKNKVNGAPDTAKATNRISQISPCSTKKRKEPPSILHPTGNGSASSNKKKPPAVQ
jgi:hypothetical protein